VYTFDETTYVDPSKVPIITRRKGVNERPDTFNDKQSQIAERKTGNGRGPGNHSQEAV
jgi:hypothetical protein